MATDARNHTVPSAASKPERADFDRLSLSTNDYVVVANTTARAAKVTELSGAGTPVSTTRPLLVWRQDASPGRELEVSTNGTDFAAYQSGTGVNAGTTISGVLAGTFDPLKPVYSIGFGATATTNASGDATVALPAGLGTLTCLLDADVNGRGSSAFPISAHIFTTLGTSLTQVSMRVYNGTAAAASTAVSIGMRVWYQR